MLRWIIIGCLIAGHISAIVGCYLIASGICLLPESSVTGANIFVYIFAGLMSILGGFCFIFNALAVKGKFLWVKKD